MKMNGMRHEKGNNVGRLAFLAFMAILILVVLFFPFLCGGRILYLTIIGLVGAILALGTNIFFGYCGQINFGAAGFFAAGGYGVALLEKYLNLPFAINLILAVIIVGFLTLLISLCLVRMRGHGLALGTLAFALGIHASVSKGFVAFTGGEDGINLAPLILFNGSKAGDSFFYYLLVAAVAACYWVSWVLRNSRVGRAMVGIAQNETAAASVGVDIKKYLRIALVLNGVMGGLAGGIFVKWASWCAPEYFNLMCNVIILLSVVVGGTGSTLGAVVGGASMYILPQLLIALAEFHVLFYGVILAIFLRFLPRGIVGETQRLYYWLSLRRSTNRIEGR